MIDSISIRVTDLMIHKQIISEADQDIYQYGFELLISTIINVFLVVSIGCLFHKLPQTILFLFEYCTVKRFAGGYHAKTYARCIITFSVLYFAMLTAFQIFHINEVNGIFILLYAISFFLVFKFAPVEDINKPLDAEEKKHFALRSKQFIVLAGIVNLVLYLCIGNQYSFMLYAIAAQIWIGGAVLTGYLLKVGD